MKGGHQHRRNYCICSQCGKWFRRNKGIHEMMSYGPIHFCNKYCSDAAEFEASLEFDVGGCYEPHYYDNAAASCDVDRDVGVCYEPNYEERM